MDFETIAKYGEEKKKQARRAPLLLCESLINQGLVAASTLRLSGTVH